MKIERAPEIEPRLRAALRKAGKREIGGMLMAEQLGCASSVIPTHTRRPSTNSSNVRAAIINGSIISVNGTPIHGFRLSRAWRMSPQCPASWRIAIRQSNSPSC
jgi:hypothetical protein